MKTISFCTLACAFFLAGQAIAQKRHSSSRKPPLPRPAAMPRHLRRHLRSPADAPSAQPSAKTPAPIVCATHYDGWYTFNGDLEAQNYSRRPDHADNVGG